MKLRDYQFSLTSEITTSASQRLIVVLPTGAGKTICMASIAKDTPGNVCLVAHRQELVGQISTALAIVGVRHRVIASSSVIRGVVKRHLNATGRSWIDHDERVAVAGIDTLIRNYEKLDAWRHQVRLTQLDEAHHMLPNNKWGQLIKIFPNARLIGWTATPCRADKKPLRQVFDTMIVGPNMRELINRGHLADYRVYGPPESIDVRDVAIARDGDYNQPQLRITAQKSRIMGDVVKHYLRLAHGKLGMTFCVDVDAAERQAQAFCDAGVPAIALSAKIPDDQRFNAIKRFERREIMQICNVDLFGEGVDVPTLECVSMARPTMSYGLFVQQFGRALRPTSTKEYGIIIDHVGNIRRHYLPDAETTWSLDEAPSRRRTTTGACVRFCTKCFRPYEPWLRACPHCGFAAEPVSRASIEHVEGDLTEYDPELLARLRRQVAAVSETYALRTNATPRDIVIHRRRNEQADAQRALREALTWWGGWARDVQRMGDSEAYRLFWLTFGADAMTAQTMSAPEMIVLTNRVYASIQ